MAVLALEMKVLTQRNGSRPFDLWSATMIAACAATSTPGALKLARPSVTRCACESRADLAQAEMVASLQSGSRRSSHALDGPPRLVRGQP